MITFHTNGVNYDDLIFELIKELESSGQNQFALHDDSLHIPTIGIGFNVTQGFVRDAVLDEFGMLTSGHGTYDLSNVIAGGGTAVDYFEAVEDIIGAFAFAPGPGTPGDLMLTSFAELQGALDDLMAAWSAEPTVIASVTDPRSTFAFRSEQEIIDVFDQIKIVFNTDVQQFDAFFNIGGIPADSREAAALFSLAYNSVVHPTGHPRAGEPTLLGTGLGTALQEGDRAEAWFEIRYNSNSTSSDGIAKRRILESHVFGLYDELTPDASFRLSSETDALQVFRMLNKHETRINTYEGNHNDQYGPANENLNGVVPPATGSNGINARYAGQNLGVIQDLPQSLEPARRTLTEQHADLDALAPGLIDLLGEAGYQGHLARLTTDQSVANGLLTHVAIDGQLSNNIAAAALRNVLVAAESQSAGEVTAHTVDRSAAPAANDLIFGSIEENNSVIGIAANVSDTLLGGGGDDFFVGGGGADVIDGEGDEDTISYLDSPTEIDVDLSDGAVENGGTNSFAKGDTLANIENVLGTDFNDKITGSDVQNVLFGGEGNDTLSGKAGDDVLVGADNDDILIGGAGDDYLDGGDDLDVADYSQETGGAAITATISFDYPPFVEGLFVTDSFGDTDTLANVETIVGTALADTFNIYGLIPAGLNLTLDSGQRDSTTRDVINFLAGVTGVSVDIRPDGDISSGNPNIGTIKNKDGTGGVINLIGFNTEIIGTDFNDRIIDLTNSVHVINGGDGVDEIIIAGAGGTVQGGLGDDVLGVIEGGSSLDGGDGQDLLVGSLGADTLLGGADDDIIHGGFGDDLVDGGDGIDAFYFASPEEDVIGGIIGETVPGAVNASIVATISSGSSEEAIISAVSEAASGTSTLSHIESVLFSDHADVLNIAQSGLDANTTIELGLNSSNSKDTVDYSELAHGVNYFNGHVSERHGSVNQYGLLSNGLGMLGEELATAADAFLHDATGLNLYNENLVVKGAEHILLTDHDDAFIVGAPTPGDGALLLTTGAGADKIYFSNNLGVTDLSLDDRISLFGVMTLFGGSKSVTSNSEYVTGLAGVQYGLNDLGELVVHIPWMNGADMFILNWEDSKINEFTGGGDITLFEYETWTGRLLDDDKPSGLTQKGFWEIFGLSIKTMVGWDAYGGGDPLVLDLDGDGIELTTLNSISPQYDIDNDLYSEQTAFVDPDDGMLARDINGDGVINDASELFGYGTTSGFDVLGALDGNLDGKIDANDNGLADFNGDGTVDGNDLYSSLLVWQDTDRDIVSDAGELTSLESLGIVSLSLSTSTPGSQAASGGNRITEVSTFTRTDASQGDIANVVLRVDNQDSVYQGAPITVTSAAEALPDLRASGTVVTLREAMSNRAASLTAVTNALANFTTPDLETLRDEVRPILLAWAEGSPIRLADGTIVDGPAGLSDYDDIIIVRDSNGDMVDWGPQGAVLEDPSYTTSVLSGEDIAVHERLIGESLAAFFLEPDNHGASLNVMSQLIENIEQDLDLFAVRIAVQNGPLAQYFGSIDYSIETDKFSSNDGEQLKGVFSALMTDAAGEGDPIAWLSGWEGFLDVLVGDYSRGGAHLKNSYGFLTQNIVAAFEELDPGFDFLDAAEALGVPRDLFALGAGTVTGTGEADIFYLDGADQTLVGGTGVDNYIVGQAIGNDVINDTESYGQSRGSDYLRFSYHNSSDISASRQGIDLILTVITTGETITVKNQFDGKWPGPIVGDTSDDTGVNEIMFANGEVWTKLDIAYAVSDVDPAGTTINGTRDIDVLEGGAGDDTLNGGGDSDIYIIGRGDGQDTINDNEDNDFRNAYDILQFTDGITQDELTFTRDGASNNITIGIEGSSDSVTINGQFQATETGAFGTWWEDRIEIFAFDDGSGLNYNDIMDLTLQTYSTSGDDFLYGFDRADRLDAGAGNDFMSGGDYDDTYIFGVGYGQDIIHDNLGNILTGDFDRVVFNADVSPEDIIFAPSTSATNSITLQIAGTSDTLTILNQYGLTPTGAFGTIAFDRIEELVFTDGSEVTWTANDVREQVLAAAATSGDDHIYGFTTADVIDGGAGNDILEGFGSNDVYIFGRGSGNDLIRENDENILLTDMDAIDFGDVEFSEVSVGRDGNSLWFTIIDTGETVTIESQYSRWTAGGRWQSVEEFRFADQTISFNDLDPEDITLAGTTGDDILTGTWFSETFDAKEGNDLLIGRDDADIYWFGAGYGADVIRDVRGIAAWGGNDQVKFTSEVTTSNIELSRVGSDLVISIDGYADQLTIENQFGVSNYKTGVEEFHFADATVWSLRGRLEIIIEWFQRLVIHRCLQKPWRIRWSGPKPLAYSMIEVRCAMQAT